MAGHRRKATSSNAQTPKRGRRAAEPDVEQEDEINAGGHIGPIDYAPEVVNAVGEVADLAVEPAAVDAIPAQPQLVDHVEVPLAHPNEVAPVVVPLEAAANPIRPLPAVADVVQVIVEKTEKEKTIELLTECAENLKKHNGELEELCSTSKDRYSRLSYYENFLNNHSKRDSYASILHRHMKEAAAELGALEKKEEELCDKVQDMLEQDKRLRKVLENSEKYHECQVSAVKEQDRTRMHLPNQDELNSALSSLPLLNDILVNTGLFFRTVAPALGNHDLDTMAFPSWIGGFDLSKISEHKELDIGRECARLHSECVDWHIEIRKDILPSYQYFQRNKETVEFYAMNQEMMTKNVKQQQAKLKEDYATLVRKIKKIHMRKASIETLKEEENKFSATQDLRDEQFKKIRQEVNKELFKCEICLQQMTNTDSSERCPKMFSGCGHTVCAECVPNFKVPNAARWLCPECGTSSGPLVTNWTLMKMIDQAWGRNTNLILID